jgi:hypothetical protein
MDRADAAPALRVAVAWSVREGEACEIGIELPAGASVLDAIRASGMLEQGGAVDVSTQAIGIWGRVASLETRLAEGDRVEIYRPLRLDPKEARRLRARRRK